ncbi:MAG: N-acetylneuraminate synthase family protein, partial [Gemmatimonadaceae bacterium]
MPTLRIAERMVGEENPTYFIADIAANHDGDVERAIALIHLAAEAGADAAKFQHFRAEHIVSKQGFESGPKMSHQSKWK